MSARKSNSRTSITVEEAMERMGNDPDYQQRRKELEKRRVEAVARHACECAPILKELSEIGYAYRSLDDLRRSGTVYRAAIPILLEWLPRVNDYNVKESIVRTLTVPWAKPEAAPALIAEFRKVADGGAGGHFLKWSIGNALAVVADDGVVDDLIELVTDARHGKSREMMAVALGNMRDRRVGDVLLGLLQDEQVAGHAIIGLGKLKSLSARPYIEPFLKHNKSWIRAEAKKAIERIDRAALKTQAVQGTKRGRIQ